MPSDIISEWFDEYSDDIYQFLIYRVGPTDAEDVLQEVFIKAYKGFPKFQQRSSPKTWLFSIARNISVDVNRKKKARRWWSMIPLDSTEEPKTTKTPEEIISIDEESSQIFKAIQSLKPTYQDVIILRGIKELSVEETSKILKWSKSKVRSTHQRAKIALQKELREGISHDEARSGSIR